MAKVQRAHIFGICLVSCCALILLIVSISTENWIESDIKPLSENITKISHVTYGLFKGDYTRRVLSTTNYEMFMTCVFGKNKCALSCQNTAQNRRNEVEVMLTGGSVNFNCFGQSVFNANNQYQTKKVSEKLYMNAGLWVATVLFLIITMVLALFSTILGFVNSNSNPYMTIFNLPGIVLCNIIAIVANITTIILWGAQFGAYIVHNIALVDTIKEEYTSDGFASLGYSYWILFPTILCFGINIALVYHREYMLNKQPSAESIAVEQNTDGAIFLY